MRKSRLLTCFLAASILISPLIAAAQEEGGFIGGGGSGGGIPPGVICLMGAAFGPIWSTLQLNRELKANEAYQSMSLCGLGSVLLVTQNGQNTKKKNGN